MSQQASQAVDDGCCTCTLVFLMEICRWAPRLLLGVIACPPDRPRQEVISPNIVGLNILIRPRKMRRLTVNSQQVRAVAQVPCLVARPHCHVRRVAADMCASMRAEIDTGIQLWTF